MYKSIFEGANHPLVAGCLNNVGTAYGFSGDFDQKLKYQLESLKMYEELYESTNNPLIASVLNKIALTYRRLGDVENEIQYNQRSLKMRQVFAVFFLYSIIKFYCYNY